MVVLSYIAKYQVLSETGCLWFKIKISEQPHFMKMKINLMTLTLAMMFTRNNY